MRNKFFDLIRDGVASFEHKPVAAEVPQRDPLVVLYNQYWGAATDTHCAYVDGRYIVTGHFLWPEAGRTPQDNKYLNTLKWSSHVNGVDVTPSGFTSLSSMLASVHKEPMVISYNNDIALEFVEMEDCMYAGIPDACCKCDSSIPVPVASFESVPGTIKEMAGRYDNLTDLCEAFNASNWVRGVWETSGNQLACTVRGQKYIIEARVAQSEETQRLRQIKNKALSKLNAAKKKGLDTEQLEKDLEQAWADYNASKAADASGATSGKPVGKPAETAAPVSDPAPAPKSMLDKANKKATVDVPTVVKDMVAKWSDKVKVTISGNLVELTGHSTGNQTIPAEIIKLFEGSDYTLGIGSDGNSALGEFPEGEYHNIKFLLAHYWGTRIYQGPVKFVDCVFDCMQGGGIELHQQHKVEFENCKFYAPLNASGKEDGVYFKDCEFLTGGRHREGGKLYVGDARPGFLPINIKKTLEKLVKKPPTKPEDVTNALGIKRSDGVISIATMVVNLFWYPETSKGNISVFVSDNFKPNTLYLRKKSKEKYLGRQKPDEIIAEYPFDWSK